MIQATKYLALISTILYIIGVAQIAVGTHTEEPALAGIGAVITFVALGTFLGFSTSWICEDNKKK